MAKKRSLSAGIWERRGSSTMSRNLFNLLVCAWTGVGIASSAVAASFTMHMTEFGWIEIIGVLVVSIAGVFIALKSDNPIISLLGYAMVTIPFGLMLGPIVAMYTAASVVKVLFVTVCMVAVLGVVGAVIPESLEGFAPYLLGGLLLLLLGYFMIPLAALFGLPIEGALTWMDWLGILLFGAYVVYDFNRAQRVPRTLDNSIDCALAIYLDFINIFVRLLSLTGVKKD